MSDLNGVILQFFHWYLPADGSHWHELASRADDLARAGVTAVWLPPAAKGQNGPDDVGYGVYDLFDLGEFNQKRAVRTKYGTKEELVEAIDAAHEAGLQVYCDVVFNHKDGGDAKERFHAQPVKEKNRNEPAGPWRDIVAWTKFSFKKRGGQYSSLEWRWWHFDAVSYDAITNRADTIYRLKDKRFETEVSHEFGNYDYLMGCDLDTRHPEVIAELEHWGRWLLDETGADGFRVDAVKHIRSSFFPGWLSAMRGHAGRELFAVGEYWSGDVGQLLGYLDRTDGAMSLFDVPLHYAFHEAGETGEGYDLRRLLDGTLARERPERAVTFVDNHDTQPYASLHSPVAEWFKPLAYAVILLRREGYPCVFYADYYGASYWNADETDDVRIGPHRFLLDRFLWARREHAYGEQLDYFDDPNTVGWTRLGDDDHPKAIAVLLTNTSEGRKWMDVGRPGAEFFDVTGHVPERVVADEHGWAEFRCPGGSVSVWVEE